MQNHASSAILDALKRLYKYRRENKIGGLSNAFPLYLLENIDGFNSTIELMSDEISRELIMWFIEFRIINSFLANKEKTKYCLDPLICSSHYNALKAAAHNHRAISLKASLDVDIIENWLLEGYKLPGICEPEAGDIVLDCGAFNGNSSLYFAEHVGESGRVIAFEPDPTTIDQLKSNIAASRIGARIEVHNIALSEQNGDLQFSRRGAASHVDPNGDVVVLSKPIDNIVDELELQKVNIIKFDIEGHEKQAINGAIRTIKHY